MLKALREKMIEVSTDSIGQVAYTEYNQFMPELPSSLENEIK